MIGDGIVRIVQLYVVVTQLGEKCFRWFLHLRSAGMELTKSVLSADIGSGSVQLDF